MAIFVALLSMPMKLLSLLFVLGAFQTFQPVQPVLIDELPNPKPIDVAAWSRVKAPTCSWGSADVRYAQEQVPAITKPVRSLAQTAWRGEQVSAQALVWSPKDVGAITLDLSAFEGREGAFTGTADFVRYVMQDNFLTCGHRTAYADYDTTLVADMVDSYTKELPLAAFSVRPVWVTVKVPAQTAPGTYKGTLRILGDGQPLGTLGMTIQVVDRVLPEPTEWAFHLDFWQNPYAEARMFGMEPFTPAYFEAVRPTFERLRDAGQKVITTSIMHKPWGGQTYDYFESMISWIKRVDGTWLFDYTIFDRWVSFMMEVGIDQQIACYSMIPWSLSFKYFDQQSNDMKTLVTTTDSPEYKEMWLAVLRDFAAHLKEKGWFDRTVIAMDERAPKAMQDAFNIIFEADPAYKVSLAGGYHPQIEDKLYDYCIVSDHVASPEFLENRHNKGQITTYYTCCAQKYPNMFTYSPLSEGEWIGWFAAAKGYDGYLRWAYNSYPKNPLQDARFRSFQTGDCFLVYPYNMTSLRFEMFVNGVEAFEKIRLLREAFTAAGNTKGLKKMDDILSAFDIAHFETGVDPSVTLQKARALLNAL